MTSAISLLPGVRYGATGTRPPKKVGDAIGTGLIRLTCKPFRTIISLATGREVTQVRLYDLLGKIVNISPVKNNQIVWNHVPRNGTYLIAFSDDKSNSEKVTLFQ